MKDLDHTNVKIEINKELCQKWIRKLEVDTEDFNGINDLEDTGSVLQLKMNSENIFKAYGKNSEIQVSETDVNCLGRPISVGQGEDKIKVDNIVTHYEFRIILNNVTLTINTDNGHIVDREGNQKFDCWVKKKRGSST